MQFDPKTELYTLPPLSCAEVGALRSALLFRQRHWKGEAETFEQLASDPTFDRDKMEANARAMRELEDATAALLTRLDP